MNKNKTIDLKDIPSDEKSLCAQYGYLHFLDAKTRCFEQKINTTGKGLIHRGIGIPLEDGYLPAYFARPIGKTNLPIVIIMQDIFGLHDHVCDLAKRFAQLGYLAVVPALYAPYCYQQNFHLITDLFAKIKSISDSQILNNIDATVRWAQKEGNGDIKRLGVTGFCWGGRFVWLYAARCNNLSAAVAWYGKLVEDKSPEHPAHPIDVINQLKVPVLGLYGEADEVIPLDEIKKMQDELNNTGSHSTIIIYPDTPHAFFFDSRTDYRIREAHDGWRRLLDWFQRWGVT